MQIHRAAFLLLLYPAAAAAQSAGDPLLAEVRQLRLAIERAMSLWPHSQLVLQRVGLQQQHVETLSRQLDQLRDQLTRSTSDAGQTAANITRMESILNQEQNEARRKDLESEIKRLKSASEDIATRNQQLQARESQLAAQLQTEQSKLTELNDRLDGFERMLQTAPGR